MKTLVLNLDPEQERRLLDLAALARRSAEDLGREALDRFLRLHEAPAAPAPTGDEALERMIGLVPSGPTDASERHDVRPGDPS